MVVMALCRIGRTARGKERVWDAGRPVDLRGTLAPLARGTGDPAHRFVDGRFWWACATPGGRRHDRAVRARHRGVGRPRGATAPIGCSSGCRRCSAKAMTGLRSTCGAYPALHRVLRTSPGLRLCATGLIFDALVPSVLEQKVTGHEARRSWRTLLRWFGEPAPGPTPVPMRVPPSAAVLREVTTWDWHRMGVDLKRSSTIRAAASIANRLEECAAMSPADALARLRYVPGVGEWTAAETAQRAIGHPDAVSVGDFHIKNWVVHALTGRARGTDAEMVELLAPWAGQRQRVVRLIELSGRGGARSSGRASRPNDIRAI